MIARGRYGIEYFPKPEQGGSGGFGWFVVAVVVLAVISLSWTLYLRRDRPAEGDMTDPADTAPVATVAPAEKTAVRPAPPPPPNKVAVNAPERPLRLRNLLLRLEGAEAERNYEMAAATIEQIREIPQAADLDEALAQRLGTLNCWRLFERRQPKWVRKVTVKRGDTASRIAADHHCTLASLLKLNGGQADRLRVGDELYVLSNPRFTLVVRRRLQKADLMLADRFFRRYDLVAPFPGPERDGIRKTTSRLGSNLREWGVNLATPAMRELELLVPVGSTVTISET